MEEIHLLGDSLSIISSVNMRNVKISALDIYEYHVKMFEWSRLYMVPASIHGNLILVNCGGEHEVMQDLLVHFL